MSALSTLQMVIFAFTPMVVTIGLVASIAWYRTKNCPASGDAPERLLSAAIRHMPAERSEWGEAMMSELIHLHAHGTSFRWCFALGCVRAALFPPSVSAWPRSWIESVKRLRSACGVLSIALPTLGIPLLWLTAIACNAFMTHDNFSSGELIPTVLAVCIMLSIACTLSGIPFGIAGLLRRERLRWLSLLGPLKSVTTFGYLMIVMHLVAGGPGGD